MEKTMIWLCLLVFGLQSQAQTQAQNRPCQTPEYRQMDFWIGDWEVFDTEGKLVGTNRIEQILGSCVLMENWKGNGGSVGHSFNIFNRQTQRWEQTWVDNGGSVIYFHGEWKEGKMEYLSETTDPKGKPLLFKMTFEPHSDGSVHQLWVASSDEGKEWTVLFDGLYKQKGKR